MDIVPLARWFENNGDGTRVDLLGISSDMEASGFPPERLVEKTGLVEEFIWAGLRADHGFETKHRRMTGEVNQQLGTPLHIPAVPPVPLFDIVFAFDKRAKF